MDHISADKEWRKLQVHIDQRFGSYLREGLDRKNFESHGVFGVNSVPKTALTPIKGESTNEKNT
ncbi:MAG TPA: hypothetical protein DCG53_06995 [Syntrophus sp. (in: bacteria)]|jgi:hypothetical protein|nr:hypothetical protein [Syntrophus sp. (in: bacteria)]